MNQVESAFALSPAENSTFRNAPDFGGLSEAFYNPAVKRRQLSKVSGNCPGFAAHKQARPA